MSLTIYGYGVRSFMKGESHVQVIISRATDLEIEVLIRYSALKISPVV